MAQMHYGFQGQKRTGEKSYYTFMVLITSSNCVHVHSNQLVGGGYIAPARASHFEMLISQVTAVQSTGKNLAVVVVAYKLAPEARYPVQLKQAVSALLYLIKREKFSPSNVSFLHVDFEPFQLIAAYIK
jgi:hypothetical protein